MNTVVDIGITLVAIALVIFMAWSLWSLGKSPLNPTQRIWWLFAIIILPGIGSFAWWWWIKRYYPRRHAEDPQWDPASKKQASSQMGRPRPSRGRYRHPGD